MTRRTMSPVVAAAGVTAVLLLAACGDDSSAATAGTDNMLQVTASDYKFAVQGELEAGAVSIAVKNDGEEFHEIAMGRLLDGHTVDDVRAALDAADEETENPLDGIVDQSVIDDLGGVQAPGAAYTITGQRR